MNLPCWRYCVRTSCRRLATLKPSGRCTKNSRLSPGRWRRIGASHTYSSILPSSWMRHSPISYRFLTDTEIHDVQDQQARLLTTASVLCTTSRLASLLKDHPRIRHVSHREPYKLPSVGAELIQSGLHSFSIGNHLNNLVLIAFRLLSLDREWLNKKQQKPKSSKADDCDQPRDRNSYGQHRSPRIACELGMRNSPVFADAEIHFKR